MVEAEAKREEGGCNVGRSWVCVCVLCAGWVTTLFSHLVATTGTNSFSPSEKMWYGSHPQRRHSP